MGQEAISILVEEICVVNTVQVFMEMQIAGTGNGEMVSRRRSDSNKGTESRGESAEGHCP